jgi:hypothetical protein
MVNCVATSTAPGVPDGVGEGVVWAWAGEARNRLSTAIALARSETSRTAGRARVRDRVAVGEE